MADRTPPAVPDGLELRKDGTARLTIDGKGWVLRRPKLGEFRKLRTLAQERDDARQDAVAGFVDLPDPGKDAPAEERTTYLRALRDRGRALEDLTTDLNIAWMVAAFAMLADDDVPPSDDWPAGLQQSEAMAALLDHWRQVPLRSGGS